MHESLKVYLKDSFVEWLSHETVGDACTRRTSVNCYPSIPR